MPSITKLYTLSLHDALPIFIKKGRVVAGTVTPYMVAELGISVRAGAPKPDISTVDAYKATLLAAKSIGYSRGCSGRNTAEGIARSEEHTSELQSHSDLVCRLSRSYTPFPYTTLFRSSSRRAESLPAL